MNCANHPDAPAAAIGRCIACGIPVCQACQVTANGEDYCVKCLQLKSQGPAAEGAVPPGKEQRSPALAAILSFMIGGAGQIYNGQLGKGLFIFFTSWLILPWIYGIFNAYGTAKKINAGEIAIKRRSGCVAVLIVVAVLFLLLPFFAILAAIAIPTVMKARQGTVMEMMGPPAQVDVGQTVSGTATGGEDGAHPAGEEQPEAQPLRVLKKLRYVKVYLKNGHIFEAEIERETPDSYVFRIGRGTFEVDKDEVKRMKDL